MTQTTLEDRLYTLRQRVRHYLDQSTELVVAASALEANLQGLWEEIDSELLSERSGQY